MAPTLSAPAKTITRSGTYVAAGDIVLYGARLAGTEDRFDLCVKQGDAVRCQGEDGMGNEYVSVNGREWLVESAQLAQVPFGR